MPPKQQQQQKGPHAVAKTSSDQRPPRDQHDVDGADRSTQNNHNKTMLGAEEKFKTGPFSLLYQAVHTPTTRVLILMRNQKRIVAKIRAFDRHFNMLLQDCQEISGETDASGHPKMRHIPKMFLRGDTVISVVAVKADSA